MIKVLFVCLGNICRSPTAEAVMTGLLAQAGLSDRVFVDSAGTADWHVGKPADERSVAAAAERGYDMSHLRARQVNVDDFRNFDYVLAMDESNYQHLVLLCPENTRAQPKKLLAHYGRLEVQDVPDPYYGGADGFHQVLDLLEDACHSLLHEIQATL